MQTSIRPLTPSSFWKTMLTTGKACLLTLFLALGAAFVARAEIIVYEGFDYPDGSKIDGQNGGFGWVTPWGTTAGATNVLGSLSYIDGLGNILITTGNKLFSSGTNATTGNLNSQSFRNLPVTRGTNETTTWLSYLILRSGITVNNPANIYPRGANLSWFTNGTEVWGVGNPSLATTNNIGLIRGGNIPNLRPSTNPPTPFNQVNLAVVRIDHKHPGADYAWMWVNPILSAEPNTNFPSCQTLGEFDYTFNRTRTFAGNNAASGPPAELTLDEIRVGTTFSDVMPFIPGQGKDVVWEGAVSTNWDLVTLNWRTNQSDPLTITNFGNGDAVLFNDFGSANTNVYITGQIFPSSLTVSNNSVQYLLEGTGPVSGIFGIVKRGSNKLTIAVPDISTGPITLLQGTLQIGNGGTVGNLGGGVIANNAALVFNRSDDYVVGNAMSGGGSVTQDGTGSVSLNNLSAHAGGTVVNSGTLYINNLFVGGGTLTGASGATVGGHGSNSGPSTISGTLSPGSASATAGTFGATALTLSSGATVNFDVNTNNTVGSRTNDLIQTGSLNLNNNVITVNFLQGIVTTGLVYRVANYTTNKTGNFNSSVTLPPARYTASISDATTNQINMTFSGVGPSSLIWNSTNTGDWDVGATANWTNATTGQLTNDFYYNFDNVTLNDSSAVTNLTLNASINPARVTVDNTVNTYTISGTGRFTGPMTLNKSGSGLLFLDEAGGSTYSGGLVISNGTVVIGRNTTNSGGVYISSTSTLQIGTNGGTGGIPSGNITNENILIFNRGADLTIAGVISGTGSISTLDSALLALNAANTYTGTVSIAAGTLRTGNGGALGRTNNGTFIASGATLDVNGQNLGNEPVTVEGAGVGSNGAIINNGAQQLNALRSVIMTGATTVGGSGRFDIRESATLAANASLSGNFTVTKISTNMFSLVGVLASGIGDIIVKEGTFGIERGTTLGSTATITVSNGATLNLFSNSVPIERAVSLAGDGVTSTVIMNAGSCVIQGAVTLAGTPVFVGNGVNLSLDGGVSGTAGIIKSGTSRLTLNSASSYSGTTTISNGFVIVAAAKTGGSGITVASGALGGGSSVTEDVVVNGGIAPGNPISFAQTAQTLTINGNVTMNDSTNAFELSISPAGANDAIQVNGNLSMTGTNTMRIAVLNYLTVGDTYTLINYTGTPTLVDTNHIQIAASLGYQYQLIDPATTPGSVKILVTGALGFDQWTASVNGNWDVNTTANWLKNGLGSVFTNSDIANFLESPTPNTTNVNIVGTVMPTAIFFTNFSLTYQLTGTGKISGPATMYLAGGVPVYIENSGDNDFSGPTTVDGDNPDGGGLMPQLWIGNAIAGGGPSGSLGGGHITNNASIHINRTGSITFSNNISGRGTITNRGTGLVTLAGTNSSYTGDTYALSGATLIAGNPTAFGLGTTNGAPAVREGATYIESGATLDVNAMNLGFEQIVASGGGTSGQGAIINNSTNPQTQAIHFLMLRGDITLGGNSRWDIRNDGALLTEPALSEYKITKIGTNQFSLVAITNIDANLGDIVIQEGVFAIQTSTMQVGDPTNTITVGTNGTLNEWNLTASRVNKKIVMQHGGRIWNENGNTTNVGPVTIQGSNTFHVQGTTLAFVSNGINGAGSLYKIGGGTLFISSSNVYLGNTIISNGTITLVGIAALTNSPIVDFAGTGTIDVTAKNDATHTVRSGTILRGVGTVRGNVTVLSGGTIEAGHSVGTMVVTTNLTLNSGITTVMELDAAAVTSDRFGGIAGTTNTIVYGGTLNVTNINGTLGAGQTYQLFSATNITGSFTAVNLPPLGNTVLLYWTNNLAVNGTISVVARPQPRIRNAVTFDGSTLNVDGFSTNGTLAGNYYVLQSTNVELPLTQWTPIQTNAFGGGGEFNFTAPMTSPALFYIIQLP